MPDSSAKNSDIWLELEQWRKKIDAIDHQLASLLCQRLDCARNISALKELIGEDVLQPEREKEVLNNVLNHADSELVAATLEKIYRSIIDESRLFQHEWKSKQQSLLSR